MEVQYVYVKPRSQFGKQCFFHDDGPTIEANILPEAQHGKDYIDRSYVDRAVQKSAQLAVHEMQTCGLTMENRGMCHVEGGWPKEINPKDPEVTQRYRRRTEKDDNWAPVMRNLMKPMERYVLQNNAINIHENYFDDMVPSDLVLSYEARKVHLFIDPQPIRRPISHLSWSPDHRNRLAASYCFMEFEESLPEVSTSSYIWDIENPHEPIMTLRPLSAAMSIEFNPHDSWLLAGGLMSGQVCYWDTRIADKPVEMSHRQFSHRQPANQVLWTTSKTNTEFFSSSHDGVIKWWDLRALKKPTEVLVMDLQEPQRADLVRAIGVSSLHFEPTMGSKCMAGMENGMLVNINRKGQSVVEKLAARFDCHKCPVLSVDRNPFSLKHFLTVGYWTVKLWADDVKESDLASLSNLETFFTGGCWSRARYSVFFTVNRKGILGVYDLLNGISSPLTAIKICSDCLTTIKPHENGALLAIANEKGKVFLVKCLEGLTTTSKTEKTLVSAYLERIGRFEKLIDNRLKELRIMVTAKSGFDVAGVEEPSPRANVAQQKSKTDQRGEMLERNLSRASKKKVKPKKSDKSLSAAADLVDAEKKYLEVIKAEVEKYAKAREAFGYSASVKPSGMLPKKKKAPKAQTSKKDAKSDKKPEPLRKRPESIEPPARPIRYKKAEPELILEEEEDEVGEDEVEEEVKSGKREKRVIRKVCPPWIVCKPEICCKDVKESLALAKAMRAKRAKRGKQVRRLRSERQRNISVPVEPQIASAKDTYFEEIMSTVEKIPERTTAAKLRILREMREPVSSVLRSEVRRARKELENWKKTTGYGRYNLRKVLRDMIKDETTRKSKPEIGGTTYRISEDVEDPSTHDSAIDNLGEPIPGTRLISDRTIRGTSATESRRKTAGTMAETSVLALDEIRKTSAEVKTMSESPKKFDPCDVRAFPLAIGEIMKASGVKLRDPVSLRPAPPETEDKVFFRRKEDYPRISGAHTHHPPDEPL